MVETFPMKCSLYMCLLSADPAESVRQHRCIYKNCALFVNWTVCVTGWQGRSSLCQSPSWITCRTGARLINTCFQLGDFLIRFCLDVEEKAHAWSRRRCSWIRNLLNERSRRTASRGASFIFIWAGAPRSSLQGPLIEKGLQKCDC